MTSAPWLHSAPSAADSWVLNQQLEYLLTDRQPASCSLHPVVTSKAQTKQTNKITHGKKSQWSDRWMELQLFSVFLYGVIWVRSNEQGEAHMAEIPNPASHLVIDIEFACSAYSSSTTSFPCFTVFEVCVGFTLCHSLFCLSMSNACRILMFCSGSCNMENLPSNV